MALLRCSLRQDRRLTALLSFPHEQEKHNLQLLPHTSWVLVSERVIYHHRRPQVIRFPRGCNSIRSSFQPKSGTTSRVRTRSNAENYSPFYCFNPAHWWHHYYWRKLTGEGRGQQCKCSAVPKRNRRTVPSAPIGHLERDTTRTYIWRQVHGYVWFGKGSGSRLTPLMKGCVWHFHHHIELPTSATQRSTSSTSCYQISNSMADQGDEIFTYSFYQPQTDPPITIDGFNLGLSSFLGATAQIERIEYEDGVISGFHYRAWRCFTPAMLFDVTYSFSKNAPPPLPSQSAVPVQHGEESEYTYVGSEPEEEGEWILDRPNGRRYWVVKGEVLKTEHLAAAEAVSMPTIDQYVPPDDPSKPDGWHWIGTRHGYYRDGKFVQWALQDLPPPLPSATSIADATPRTIPSEGNVLGAGVNMIEQVETVYSAEHQRNYTRRVSDGKFIEWL
ncbi:hypothetical protein BJ508DRAFT_339641 [Ascobolus immersus RN42]|uniref:Uncharacterized protein n=1 Tax=Ascobolus immersus RN42 TaxID=1160509 RepID=A0A3N4HS36_ASCIM|nr:hypothetical protein BJ508DRAFT_339641 [Ascobolus immersus RN42]